MRGPCLPMGDYHSKFYTLKSLTLWVPVTDNQIGEEMERIN